MIYHFHQKEWILNKFKKLVDNLHVQTEYVIHIRNLKQALNYGLVLEKVYKVNNFYQNACLKPYIDINTDLRKKGKNNFGKDFFKLMKNAVLGKTMENMRKHRDYRNKKKLFGVRMKLSYYKVFHRKYISNRSEKNWHNYE